MIKIKISTEELVRLYSKYCSPCGSNAEYTFEGIRNGSVVCSRTLAPAGKMELKISCNEEQLVSDVTYDTARIELTAVDANGNRRRECNDAVSVDADGSIEVIGSRIFSMSAGSAAFYVRTKGGKGAAKIKITTESLGSHTINLDVTRTNKK